MKNIQLLYEHTARIHKEYFDKVAYRLQAEIERLQKAYLQGYSSVYASINVAHDDAMRTHVDQLVHEKKLLNIECLVVIGIGGSSLGAIAIHEALHSNYYNELSPATKVYFIETVDPDAMHDCILLLENYLRVGKRYWLMLLPNPAQPLKQSQILKLF